MTEKLPISIHTCDDLIHQFSKIISVCNKLEAQFNFQTMTANWYGDESTILFVHLSVETPTSFDLARNKNGDKEITCHRDDVFSFTEAYEKNPLLTYYIAITESELILLNKQPKLLAGFLSVKLQKVLNLIAEQLNLHTI